MADTNQKAVLTIDLDVDGLTREAARLRKEIAGITATQKELRKAGREGTLEFERNEAALRELKGELRDTNKAIDTNIKAVNAQKGSNEQLMATLSILTKQYNEMSEEMRDTTIEGHALQKQIKEISDTLKENGSAVGDNRRNVGNYSDAVQGLGGVLGNLSGRLEEVTGTITAMSASSRSASVIMKGLVGQVKALTVASLKFLATPIGAVIGVIAGLLLVLTKAFQRSEERMSKVSKVTAVISGAFNGLIKIVEPLADILIDGLLAGIDLVIGGFEKLSKFLGISNNEITETIRLSQQLVEAELALDKARREQEKTQLRFQLQAEKLRQIRDDESKTIAERIEANRELGRVLDEQIRSEQQLANQALRAAQLRLKVDGETKENLDALAEAETKLLEIQERVEGQRSEQLTNENALLKEQREKVEELRKAILDLNTSIRTINIEIRRSFAEIDKAEANRLKNARERRKRSLAAELEIIEQNNQLELEALAEKYRAIEEQARESGIKGAALRKILLEAQIAEQQELTALLLLFEQERLRIIEETAQVESDLRSEILDEIRRNAIETQLIRHQQDINEARSLEGRLALIRQNAAAQLAEVNKREELEKQAVDEKYDALFQQAQDAGLSEEELRQAEKDIIQQHEDELTEIERNASDERKGIKKDEAQSTVELRRQQTEAEIDLINAGLEAAIEAVGENKEAAKALQIAQALGNTSAAIVKTLAEPALPFPSNVITSAAIGIRGLTQVAKIRKLEKGGEAGGKSHAFGGTKYYGEDGHTVELEKGEKWFVLNKNSSRMIGALSDLNVAGGGVPFYGHSPRQSYQDGGIVERSVSSNVDQDIRFNDLLQEVINRPVQVSVEEIRSVNNRVEARERIGTF